MRGSVIRWGGAILATALITVSCGSDTSIPPPASPTTSEGLGTPALVGVWERETHCEELVSALTDAGLDRWVVEFVAGDGFVPGVTTPDQIADAANPCEGAG